MWGFRIVGDGIPRESMGPGRTNYSLNLCQSAICLCGELQTSLQWFRAESWQSAPPNSSRPITCNVSLDQSTI